MDKQYYNSYNKDVAAVLMYMGPETGMGQTTGYRLTRKPCDDYYSPDYDPVSPVELYEAFMTDKLIIVDKTNPNKWHKPVDFTFYGPDPEVHFASVVTLMNGTKCISDGGTG